MLLLYLIAVSSLANGVEFPECESNYSCFAPEQCRSDRGLEKVTGITNVQDNCFVFLKFHAYSNKKTRIIMESFGNAKTIELRQDNSGTEMLLLTCTKKDGRTKAFQGLSTPINNLISDSTRKLNCEFDVDLSLADIQGEPQLGTSQGTLDIQDAFVKTDIESTTPKQIGSSVHCLPSAILVPRDDFESNKYYEKAQYKLGRIICNNESIFNTMEFRSEETNTYRKVKDISCKKRKYEFHLNGSLQSIPSDEDLDVRCAADAEYFCDYNPKASEIDNIHTVALERQKPDIESSSPIPGTIQCPDSHPLFVIGGRREPIENAEIKCKNHYGKMKWTFKDYSTESSTEIILTETSPIVHCTNKTECHVKNKLIASNLNGSFLDPEFLPTCRNGGNLTVDSFHVNVTCNDTTGQYYYYAANFTRQVMNTTVFSCKYADIKPPGDLVPLPNMFLSGGLTFLIVFLIAAVIKYIAIKKSRRKMNAMIKQMETVDVINSKRFNVNKKGRQNEVTREDLFANDYLIKKSDEGARDVQFNVIPGEIPAADRQKSRLSPEIDANYGMRPAGVDKFVKYHPVKMSEVMERLAVIRDDAEPELERHQAQKDKRKLFAKQKSSENSGQKKSGPKKSGAKKPRSIKSGSIKSGSNNSGSNNSGSNNSGSNNSGLKHSGSSNSGVKK